MDAIEEVVAKIDIVELISSYIPLKKAGRNFKAICPFHSEKTPSLVISPELQIFKCFGCQMGGNAIKFVAEYEKISFGEALRQLAQKAGVKLESFTQDKEALLKDKIYAANGLALEFYHYILTKHPAGKIARVYLDSRGVTGESIRYFRLGFAPASWQNLVNFLTRKKGFKPLELEKAGLVLPGDRGFYDRFRDRIIFPIFDHRGNIIAFSGRVIDKQDQGAKYINSPETPVYHKSNTLYGLYQTKEAIKKEDSVILAEGELDVISSYQAGVKNIVACKGSAVTQAQVQLLSRFCQNIYFCLDKDSAGEQAAIRGIGIGEAEDINIKVINLPLGKDIDECVRKNPGLWRQAVGKPVPVYDFYINQAVNRWGAGTASDKKKITNQVLPFLNKITNQVVKAHYFKKLAQVLEVSPEAVLSEAQRLDKAKKLPRIIFKSPPAKQPKSRKELLEEYLLAVVLQSTDDFRELMKISNDDYLTTPVIKKIFGFLRQFGKNNPSFIIAEFVKILPEELKETVNRLFLASLPEFNQEKSKIGEFKNILTQVEKIYLHDKLGTLRRQLSQADLPEENAVILEKEILGITRKLRQDEKTN